MKKVRVLSLDGGGIRGIIPATIVQYIEDEIIRITKNDDARISDYFDMMVGTSTGALLACFYLTPDPKAEKDGPKAKYKASDALQFYTQDGYNIFNKSKKFSWFGARQLWDATKFSPVALEKILDDQFGDNYLHDLLKPCTLTTYSLNLKRSFFLRSTDNKVSNRIFKVKDAMRSTSAAPTYFPPAKIKNYAEKMNKGQERYLYNIDGGVFANNPTLVAFSEARNMKFEDRGIDYPSPEEMLIVSIGTGGGNFTLPPLAKSATWSVLKLAVAIPNIMMDGSVDTVHYQMRNLFGTLNKEHQHNYLRIDVDLEDRDYAADMANADEQNVKSLLTAGDKTLARVKPQLDAMILRIISGE